jgi:diguanylate cyclase (GGDEF)-like protein/PAS domain S-box-containing protein
MLASDLAAASQDHDARTAPSRRLDDRALASVLETLLVRHPEAMVAAVDPGPRGAFVPVPDSLHLGDRFLLYGRHALDIVVPADRVVVIEAWEEARAAGVARASIRLAVDPDTPAVLHLVDARTAHGVFVAMVVAEVSASDRHMAASETSPLPPRIGRIHKDELATILDVDDAILRILGWAAADLVGHRSLEFIHADDQPTAIGDWLQMLDTGQSLPPVRQRLRRADGGWAWFEVTHHNLLADPSAGFILAEMIDVSHEMAAQEALRAREQMLHRLAEALPIGVLQATADGRVVYTNNRLHRLLGVPLVLDLDDQFASVSAADRPALDEALNAALRSSRDANVEVQVRHRPDARSRQCLIRLRALTDERGASTGAILTLEDVTESARLRAELEIQATYDKLTGVLNRASILSVLDRQVAAGDGAVVIFVDLDKFKAVNDVLGHAAGDELLRWVAGRLGAVIRGGDKVGRIGGDEFLIVCTGIRTRDQASRVAARVAGALGSAATIAGQEVAVQASVGLAGPGSEAASADQLVARADAAMYQSKRRSPRRPVVDWIDAAVADTAKDASEP